MNKYISVDVELTGGNVEKHSMIAIGACDVNNLSETFYREVKPISYHFDFFAMKAASKGLKCIPANLKRRLEYDPESRLFRPQLILKLLYRFGESPAAVMQEFSGWVSRVSGIDKPVMVAKPVRVDFPFVLNYFKRFLLSAGPFGEDSVEDLEGTYRQAVHDKQASIKGLGILDTRYLEHNALEDALLQAEQFAQILKLRQNLEPANNN